MKPPSDLCSGSCKGRRENCPCPQACGWPDYEFDDKQTMKYIVWIITCIGLIVFCTGVLLWR